MLASLPEIREFAHPKAARAIAPDALDALFTGARTANGFLPEPVAPDVLERVAQLSHLPPTAVNANPLRVVFVQTPEAKARLLPALSPGNVEKTKAAPVTAILAHDLNFVETLPRLFPHMDLSGFAADPEAAAKMAHYNATLQTGYFILAARALGLDAGPMGGFDREKVDAEFFPEGTLKSDLLINLGYGDDAKLHPRNPRLGLDEIARFV
jgi:3-hydroxypropanoate dehydrogenase